MINTILFALSETDKRVLIALCFLVILVFILAGYIGFLITRIMRHQGKKMDTMMHDIVVTRVVTTKKEFLKVARKKNWRYFFKTAWIPLLILFVSFLIWITAESLYSFKYDMFDYQKTGFTTLFFLFDFTDTHDANSIYTTIFGIRVLAKWPPLLNEPHFEVEALFSYFFLPIFLTGAIWYLIDVQCLVSRTYKMYKLADAIYEKNLEGFNINKENMDQIRQNQANINQMMWNQVMNKVNNTSIPPSNLNPLNQNPVDNKSSSINPPIDSEPPKQQ